MNFVHSNHFKIRLGGSENDYEPGVRLSIKLLLRRTLVRLGSLLSTVYELFNYLNVL